MTTKAYSLADSIQHKENWQRVKLGDIAFEVSERIDNPSQSGLDRFVGLEHIDSGSFAIGHWGSTESVTSAMKFFNNGDVLFARRNAYLKRASMALFDGVCSGDAIVLREKREMIVEGFLVCILNTDALWDFAIANAAGSMSKRVKWRDLAEYEFALPPKDEQRRIADILWAADENVQQFSMCQEAFEVLRRNYQSQLILKGINHTEFQHTKIGSLPLSWNVVPIKEVGLIQLGRQRAPQYQTGLHTRPYLRVANVFDGYLDLTDVLKMDFDKEDYEKYVLKSGDILLNEGQSRELVGRCCIYRGEIKDCCFQNTLIRFQVSDKLLPEYIFGYLQHAFYEGFFAQIARQTTSIAHLGADRFANILVPVPPITEQQEIVRYLEVISQEHKSIQGHINMASKLKSKLLNDLLSNS